MKILVATDKPFAAVAVEGIKKEIEGAGLELVLLEKYGEKAKLLEAVKDVEGIIVRSDIIDAEVLDAAKNLKIVVRAGAGYDNIDLAAATAHNVCVMNTPGQNSNAVAELVFGMAVMMIRNFYNGTSGTELKGKKLGIHAFGQVGRNVARIAKGFGMDVYAFDPYCPSNVIAEAGVTPIEDINELYKNPAQRAAALQLKENELAEVKPEFSLEITKIRKFADPELNEEFFKTAFPQGNVTDEAGLDAFVDAEIGKELSRESDYLFTLQLRDFLLKKADLKMPAAFLKRWLYVINEEKFSKEEIEKDFDQFLKMFSWNYIQKHFIKEDNLTVTADEALAEAKAFAAAQFAQYGMPAAPDEMLENFAKQQILANKEQSQKIYEKLYETKVVEDVKGKIKVTEKAVSADEFAKLAKEI